MARIYRFFTRDVSSVSLPKSELKLSADFESDIFSQLTRVLRVRPGDTVVLLLQSKNRTSPEGTEEYWYQVVSAHKKEVLLTFEKLQKNTHELPFDLKLILCLPNKPDKLSFILQKAVELGVTEITLVPSDNSQMKHELRSDRLEKILLEAAEQSERGSVPTLHAHNQLKEYLAELATPERKNIYVALERDATMNLLTLKNSDASGISILIGPEGGFSEAEKKLMHALGLHTFTLGKRILRMETAAILALGIVELQQN